MATAEVVQLFLERLGKGDVDGITELFADDIDWRAPGTVLPWAGRRSHRSEVPEFFRVLESACVPAETRVDVEKILVDGEDAVVFGTYHRRFAKNGRNFDTPEAVHIRVVDGRIVRWHLYGDTGLVEDA
jgi:ketosteroid isomerase-like protein